MPSLAGLFAVHIAVGCILHQGLLMAKLGQSSFRRILLSRILLVSVPILFIGEAITFRKVRKDLLVTAHQNLTESAVTKGKSISDAIAALKANLLVASQTSVLQKGTSDAQQFLNQLAAQLPRHIQCIRLTDLQTNNIVASTCGNEHITDREYNSWSRSEERCHHVSPVPHNFKIREFEQLAEALDCMVERLKA